MSLNREKMVMRETALELDIGNADCELETGNESHNEKIMTGDRYWN